MDSPGQNKPRDPLKEKLEELESLIDKEDNDTEPNRIEVPVLDELVDESDFVEHADENNVEEIEEQIVELAEKLEDKFSGELDQLVNLLKSNMKNSIIEELRQQANLEQAGQDDLNQDDLSHDDPARVEPASNFTAQDDDKH